MLKKILQELDEEFEKNKVELIVIDDENAVKPKSILKKSQTKISKTTDVATESVGFTCKAPPLIVDTKPIPTKRHFKRLQPDDNITKRVKTSDKNDTPFKKWSVFDNKDEKKKTPFQSSSSFQNPFKIDTRGLTSKKSIKSRLGKK